ncbi:DUF397 domain-containing protein [Phytomonospora endophytica]|uniref:DUF397 domain-containing protein n=1 Tax=Phytomonospora endophytica TaxID=714109 RepID=A0A841FHH5_9ACTN|nr:DUF397 domain-containing protein [Phytomonospora endophytica]MBB6035185.1 hypothetical protein [Phytomonospora endophytica]GIG64066.1 hypothetical protein Pen01_03610 [Phytomonospora endophytica]
MSTHIEVSAWRKSTRSGSGGSGNNCVEVGAWRKSSRSGSGGTGNCIEVAACTDSAHGVAIRDTKHREGATLATDRPEWTSFVAAVRSGAFDA